MYGYYSIDWPLDNFDRIGIASLIIPSPMVCVCVGVVCVCVCVCVCVSVCVCVGGWGWGAESCVVGSSRRACENFSTTMISLEVLSIHLKMNGHTLRGRSSDIFIFASSQMRLRATLKEFFLL